jgi:hypothetical protein
MKTTLRIYTFLILLVALFMPFSSAAAGGTGDGQIIFGSNYTVRSGETLGGDLVVFGGSVMVEDGGTVNGDLVLFGGSMTVAGTVTGDLVLIGGSGILKSTAVVEGDMDTVGGSFQSESGSLVKGSTNNYSSPPALSFSLPNQITAPDLTKLPNDITRYVSAANFNPISDFAWLIMKSLGWAALAALVLMFFEKYTHRVSRAALHQPAITGSFGFITLVVVIVVTVVLAVTILLIPVALIGLLIFGFAVAFGWIAIGLEIGQRMSLMFHQDWALPLSAALGTFVLNFVANGIGFIPCIGWIVPFLITLLGLGAVVLSRFGTISYPPDLAIPGEPIDLNSSTTP